MTHIYSYSEISMWLQCNYRHHVRYEQGFEPRLDSKPINLGSAVHHIIQGYFLLGAKDPTTTHELGMGWAEQYMAAAGRDLYDEEAEELVRIVTEAKGIAQNAIEFIGLDEWQPMMFDAKFLIDQPVLQYFDDYWFRFTPDLVATHKNTGMNWLIDWKTRSQFLPNGNEETNLQARIYTHLLNRLGFNIHGYRTLQIRNHVPRLPERNANGSMSRVRIATDWPTYRNALLEANLNPENYLDMEAKLDMEFFRWDYEFCKPYEAEETWLQVALPVMDAIEKENSRHRSMNYMNCRNCWAKDYCLGGLRGDDVGYIASRDFRIVEEDDELRTGLPA